MPLLTGARVFDGVSPALVPGPVVVDGNQISAVGAIPSGDMPVIDLSGVRDATILPGLIDCHLHLAISGADQTEKMDPDPLVALRMAHHAMVNLLAGVTTARDVGAKHHIDIAFRRARALGLVPGPRMLVSGKPIIATGGHCYYMGREVDGADEATKAAREQIKVGVDWIKMMVTGGVMTPGMDPRMQQLTPDEIGAVVQTAHRAGVPVAAHAQGGPGVHAAIKAGIDSLEHGLYLTTEDVDLLAERRIVFVPTLSAFVLIAENREVAGVRPPQFGLEKARAAVEVHAKSFELAHRGGVRIAAGTDYVHGSLHIELGLMVRYGMTRVEALRAATSEAAKLLRFEDQIGSIAPGKRADLIVVEGNPLEDLDALIRVRLVMQDGRVTVQDGALVQRRGPDEVALLPELAAPFS